jgi:hypothetical protein
VLWCWRLCLPYNWILWLNWWLGSMRDSYNQNREFYGLDIMQCMSRAMHKMNPTLRTHAFVCNFRCNPWIMSQCQCLLRGRDVLISNVGMIEEYAMWRAHNLVVLSELNRQRKGCVDLQCGYDRGVCNVTCSKSCSTKRIESTKEGMCWSPMWAWPRSMERDVLMIM